MIKGVVTYFPQPGRNLETDGQLRRDAAANPIAICFRPWLTAAVNGTDSRLEPGFRELEDVVGRSKRCKREIGVVSKSNVNLVLG